MCVRVCIVGAARILQVLYISVTSFLFMDRWTLSPPGSVHPTGQVCRLLCPSPISQAFRARLPAVLRGASAHLAVTLHG